MAPAAAVASPPATPPVGASDDLAAQQLLRRSRGQLWLTLLPLLMLVIVLAAWQAQAQWRRLLDSAAAEIQAQRQTFEGVARDASHHVADLQRWMKQEFLRGDDNVNPAIVDALQQRWARDGRADGWTLDGLPELLRPGMAQVLWPQHPWPAAGSASPASGKPPPRGVLRRAQALSSVIEIAHQRNPNFVASYFYGWPDRHLVAYPWLPSSALVEERGAAALTQAVEGWYAGDAFRLGLPQHDPTAEPYWTAPYVDSNGKGLLVTRAAPVMVADELRGIVGAELRLEALAGLLERLPGPPWQAWVVDHHGRVLADRQQALALPGPDGAQAAATVPTLAQRLPEGIDGALLARAATNGGQAVAKGDLRVIAVDLAEAPWTLVLAAPRSALLKTVLPQVLPYSLIVLALLGVWLAGTALLRQRVVTPLVDVFTYLQRLSADAATPEPTLGPRWQPWVQVVTRTFGSMRSSAQAERRAEALKSAIVDHAQAAVVVADEQGRVVEFNPAAEVMLRCPREAAVGQTVRDLIMPERFRHSFDAALARMSQGDPDRLMGRRLERVARRADDSELPVEVVMWMSQVDGAIYFTASLTDLTESRANTEMIERQRDALRQSEKLTAMGSLLAGVAHELNNPLAIVMGRASLLEEKTEGSALHADAVRIREAAERCGRIVKTFLNMARSRPAQHAAVRLNDLVRAAADMLGYTLRSHGIEVELRLAADLPDVQADADQIGQVVLNLIVNAQQALASHAGPRRIAVQTGVDAGDATAPAPAAGPAVWLRVADSGAGVAAAVRGKIFEPFFTTKAEGIGTGIGLSVSRAIAREHGGDLLLEETAGNSDSCGGAAFRLRLPLVAAVPAVEVQDTPSPEPQAESARVLVVDDEPELATLLRSMLESAGFEVASADSGALALELLQTARFDAIVSDLRMPDVDGAALWRAVRERHPDLAQRMVFVTGDTLSPGARQFLDDTGCQRLDKPFARADLVAQVTRVLQTVSHDA